MATSVLRIGQIVPSSNTTMETEIPAIFRARETIRPERFTFHGSRMRMRKVTRDELKAMDVESHRCAAELADAAVDVMGYACLVAIMAQGQGYHRQSERALHEVTRQAGHPAPVVTSAGALVEELKEAGARRIAALMPYMRPLAQSVVDYIEGEGIEVHDWHALEIEDNLAVGARDPLALVDDVRKLDTKGVDAIVISACVQMPSLAALPIVERQLGVPTTSTAACTARRLMRALGIEPVAPVAGALLAPVAATA
jgi:maleate isomerase